MIFIDEAANVFHARAKRINKPRLMRRSISKGYDFSGSRDDYRGRGTFRLFQPCHQSLITLHLGINISSLTYILLAIYELSRYFVAGKRYKVLKYEQTDENYRNICFAGGHDIIIGMP